MDRILVLVPAEDRAGRALKLARGLAEQSGASVTLLRVLEENLGPAASTELCQERTKIRDLLLDVETGQLEEAARSLRETVSDVSANVCWGVAWEVLLQEAARGGADLIVKPATGLTRQGPVFFGSTALHLFRRATCPVWVVGNEGTQPRRILAAVDPTGSTRRQQASLRIVEHALSVARLTDATVEIATAWCSIGGKLLESTLGDPEWKAYRNETQQRAREGLDRLTEALGDAIAPESVHLIEGEAREAIPRFAEERDFDLIVMGTLTRPGEIGDRLGETAEMVLRGVHSSVMTVPPAESTTSES